MRDLVDDETLRAHTKIVMKIIDKEQRVKAKAKKAKRRQSRSSRRRNTG